MAATNHILEQLKSALARFANEPARDAATGLLRLLGYHSDRTLKLGDSSPKSFLDFIEASAAKSVFDKEKALCANWKTADLLFQLTDQELSRQSSLFKETEISTGLLQSYLFFAIELAGGNFARGKLTGIARQLNRVFPMPVMVLIKHQVDKSPVLSVAVINRRQHKRDAAKDVLGKVTIIRDISLSNPHRGHLDILESLALPNLVHPQRLPINNFDTLHAAWEEIFNVELLNKRFYRELANWYFWALPQVEFPAGAEKDSEKRRATSLIRLLTRLIFCWFLKEKGLIPDNLFVEAELKQHLRDLSPDSCSFHHAILQNLFFATLNQRMGKDSKGEPFRRFISEGAFQGRNKEHGVTTLYRYPELFADSDAAITLFADIPFLNGGLFECLDFEDPKHKDRVVRVDGFTTKGERPIVPNRLFFEDVHVENLSEAYGDTKKKHEKVRGLLRILHSYKFTVVENTPIDQEIALDPELLGKVFENLLASYNDETRTSARKQTGSFYTPRTIVDYMVDESLRAHLQTALTRMGMDGAATEAGLEVLFAYTDQPHPFKEREVDALLEAIHTAKILDPACGSGAFPMGMLQKLVHIIHKLDPVNAKWKQLQIDAASQIPDPSARDAAIEAIERDFAENEDDYGRKLYLIENCLYGVDIQPIAIQISKLRFFISLICDQRTNRSKKDNLGIRPLPNLETKFVAADFLIGLEFDPQLKLFTSGRITNLVAELKRVRHDHFAATTRQRKLTLQRRDREIREELQKQLTHSSLFGDQETSKKLAEWDPYDPQQSAPFFEPLWMFDQSLSSGFDLIIGNPPYVSVERFAGTPQQARWKETFKTYAARGDIYCFFYERGAEMLRSGGTLTYITSNKWMRAGYGKNLRQLFLKHVRIDGILDYGGILVFNSATVDTCTVRLSNNAASKTVPCTYIRSTFNFEIPLSDVAAANASKFKLPSDSTSSWALISGVRQALRQTVASQGVPLSKWKLQISRGVITGFNEAYYLTAAQRAQLIERDPASEELIVKLIRGREVERYRIAWEDTYQLIVKFGAYDYLESQYPAVFEHLMKYEIQLKARGQCQYSRSRSANSSLPYPGQHHWLELDNNPSDDYLSLFQRPKIIYPIITKWMGFYFDWKDHYYTNDKAFVINSEEESLTYLTAFFNSTLFRCCFKDNFPTQGEDRRELRKMFFEQVPVKRTTESVVPTFNSLVRLVQIAKDTGHVVSAQFLEDLIDACVLECYFREHMMDRDLLFHEDLRSHLLMFDPAASEAKQATFLDHLYRTLNAPDSKIRNRLLRLTADSPDLLAVIKEEGRV
jgi:adenine-specific DNA-methyltransferase